MKLLQRIRDECHRVANSYNAQLRLKRISESVLDEFPGIGERRKSALLKKFGSVRRLQLATFEQISKVPGFGGKAAEELKKFLRSARLGFAPFETIDRRAQASDGNGNTEREESHLCGGHCSMHLADNPGSAAGRINAVPTITPRIPANTINVFFINVLSLFLNSLSSILG